MSHSHFTAVSMLLAIGTHVPPAITGSELSPDSSTLQTWGSCCFVFTKVRSTESGIIGFYFVITVLSHVYSQYIYQPIVDSLCHSIPIYISHPISVLATQSFSSAKFKAMRKPAQCNDTRQQDSSLQSALWNTWLFLSLSPSTSWSELRRMIICSDASYSKFGKGIYSAPRV